MNIVEDGRVDLWIMGTRPSCSLLIAVGIRHAMWFFLHVGEVIAPGHNYAIALKQQGLGMLMWFARCS